MDKNLLKFGDDKRKDVGKIPEVMSYLIMSLRINANLEKAVQFSAQHSKSPFKEKLERILYDVRMGIGDTESGLLKLADEYKKWDEFKRSMRLVISSTLEKTESRRQKTLDKASEVLLGGLSARTEKEARALNTPVMIVFTFGVILPLIFVAIIPFMSLMGIQIGAPMVALMYVVGLPIFLLLMIRFIAANRPITMLPPDVPNENKQAFALVLAIGLGFLLTLPLFWGDSLGALEYLPLLWGIGAFSGIFLLMTTIKVKRIRKEIKELENGFGETLHQLGIILSEGRPLENAMLQSDSEFLKRAADNIQTLNTDLRSAFFDSKFGSLKDVYSETVRGMMDIIISIADKGSETMSQVAFRMSDHMKNLKKSEAEIERSLGCVVSSMRIIAMVVAPLVGGMISSMSVVLADTMVESQNANVGFGDGAAQAIDPSLITIIIGAYALESAAILVMFSTDLMHGGDKVMKKYGLGVALPVAVFVFTICALVANGLFSGIG